jgi:primase-polymerase (primpol)-like protein
LHVDLWIARAEKQSSSTAEKALSSRGCKKKKSAPDERYLPIESLGALSSSSADSALQAEWIARTARPVALYPEVFADLTRQETRFFDQGRREVARAECVN